jgi:hypothetical protein
VHLLEVAVPHVHVAESGADETGGVQVGVREPNGFARRSHEIGLDDLRSGEIAIPHAGSGEDAHRDVYASEIARFDRGEVQVHVPEL